MPSPEQSEKAIAKVKPSHATFFVMEKDLSSKQLRNVRVFFPELYTYTKDAVNYGIAQWIAAGGSMIYQNCQVYPTNSRKGKGASSRGGRIHS